MRKITLLAVLFLIFLYGCFEKPSEPVLPTWDVDLTVPILEKTFTLGELVEKDTTYFKIGSNNQIYYSTTSELEATTVGDNLKISDISTSAQTQLGNFEIKNPGTITASIKVYEIFPALSSNIPPGNYIIPSNAPGQTVSVNFTAFESFQSVKFDNGILRITATNGLPVPLIFPDGLKIYAQDDPSKTPIVALFVGDTLNPNSTKTAEANLAGKTLPAALGLTATIFSPGSGGQAVYLDVNQMFLTVSASLENLSIAEATARIPTQTEPVVIDSSFTLEPNEPQPNLINEIVFKSGQMRIEIVNNIDLGLNGSLTLYNFRKKTDNSPLQISLNIGRKNSTNNRVIQNIDLANYKLVGNLSNQISYRVEVRTEDTGDEFRTVTKNDGFSAGISLSNLVIESISGKVKPTEINFEEQRISLGGLKDYREKFKGSLRLDDIQVELNLVKTAQFTFDMNLKVKAKSIKTGKVDSLEIPIAQRRFSGTSHRIVLNKSNSNIVNFINSFTSGDGEFPDSLLITGFVFLNPNYELGQVSSSDSIYGSVTISFPASFGISNAEFRDTSEVEELSEDTKKEIDKMNYGKLFVEIENGLGVELRFRATLFGFVMDSLVSIPRANDFLITSAPVDNNGFSVGASKSINVIELERNEIQKLKNMKFIRSFISLNTAESGKIVKFRTTDSIKVKIYGTLNYKVEISNK
ncbi:hypothetical protein JGI7_01052 [Candidatus Kryptonium thompsonii]|uniref:Uncharacterized protein n=2 Tax=Candidatus Kryptonium thompsonii TaxID=1633631 RepID=A0A0P1LC90_9BACT|nr:hypothetical protein [Candidatus Kryptonium thompsoni]CUS78462.1 hypothetical protein JGI10_00268 [Candidatus Kryptonium thompsoni]CUS79941.1 hypothetical protein JGI15_10079 [Candidatus Kryptonium thompsoni]CUS84371.1 hypothetical protein JGI13_01049 [Candidatus Kryptonium thompsoni]CUS86911.1 hypothetical protein JGI7_01052 [Candidatus Kryptonium thompsoni]CUS90121.1 hypothetical protein JGI12_01330 [Candidatus Kryptonium thompsoni]